MIFFEMGFFKVGITIDLSRVEHLTKLYSKYKPVLKKSYLVKYQKHKTVKALESLLKAEFEEHKFDFNGEYHEGYTECFQLSVFDDAFFLLKDFMETVNKGKAAHEQMILKKEIVLSKTYPNKQEKNTTIKQKRNIGLDFPSKQILLNSLKHYKNNMIINLDKTTNKIKCTIKNFDEEFSFNNDIHKKFPSVIYSTPSGTGWISYNLGPSKTHWIIQQKEVQLIFNIEPVAVNFEETIGFYTDLFNILDLDTTIL
jgi:hypothetical protein